MGFLKGFMKTIVEKGVEEISERIQKTDSYIKPEKSLTKHTESVVAKPQHTGPTFYDFDGTEEDYFESIFERYFDDYYIETKVPAYRYDTYAHPSCVPVDYLFVKDDKPVLAIVLVKPNNYKGKNIMGTLDILDRAGIQWLRFFRTWENAEDYVVERIKKNLR